MDTSLKSSTVGVIEKITYHNAENSFTIAKLRIKENNSLISILGTIPKPSPGDTLKVEGKWESHSRFGMQLRVKHYKVVLPATTDGVRKYLGSGVIKGVGPGIINALILQFKEKTIEIIEQQPEKLTEVKGIGKITAQRITESWKSHHAARTLMRFLEANDISLVHLTPILKVYGKDAIEILSNDPFRAAEDIPGVGFYIADSIARNSDTPINETDRIKACIFHLLEKACDQGHVYLPANLLMEKCKTQFKIDKKAVFEGIEHLCRSEELVVEEQNSDPDSSRVYPAKLHQYETVIANRINALLSIPVLTSEEDIQHLVEPMIKTADIRLSSVQQKILKGALCEKMSIITGGPGTGKTTLIKAITSVYANTGKKCILAAPTGRAARRISEVTGKKAATIHMMLGYNPSRGAFERTPDNPLQTDLVIIDEASMIDTPLMCHLISALPMAARLILVGDECQLPAVGPGNVLSDLIASHKIMVFELTEVFRQDGNSAIILNSHRVISGKPLHLETDEDSQLHSDFFFIEQNAPEKVEETIVSLCKSRIPGRFGFDGIKEIQVLTPVHKGVAGTMNLNRLLQKNLNPKAMGVDVMGNRFQVGDKVMHLKNNYDKDVFNGDIGIVTSIEKSDETLEVNYYDRNISYDFMELDSLCPAYAISIHKSQGSEYPAIVIPLITKHYVMLQRNLLYTAITRGKKLVIIVGSKKALSIAIKNNIPRQRLTSLAMRMNPGIKQENI